VALVLYPKLEGDKALMSLSKEQATILILNLSNSIGLKKRQVLIVLLCPQRSGLKQRAYRGLTTA